MNIFSGDVTLSETGCVGAVTSALEGDFQAYIDETIQANAAPDDESCCGEGKSNTTTVNGSRNISTHAGAAAYWMGGVSISASYECSISCSGGGSIKKYDCSFVFKMNDKFENPFDFDNKSNGIIESLKDEAEFGRTFSVSHTWNRQANGTL